MLEQASFYPQERAPQAFRVEFYEKATDRQIEDDLVSFIGEYRFGVPEFEYELGIVDGKLTDPSTGESMVVKAQRAVETRQKEGLNVSREMAEKIGMNVLETKISKKPNGTVVWFSPPGSKDEGYGDYGFAYVGKIQGNGLKMTAIRLESSTVSDFNSAAEGLWGQTYETAEDFLSSPQVIEEDGEKVKEFIHGNFEIKDERVKKIFDVVCKDMAGQFEEFKAVVRGGVKQKIHNAVHVIENMSIRLKQKYEVEIDKENVIFITNPNLPSLKTALQMSEYTKVPPSVRGSCGISAKQESNDIFRGLNTNADKTPTKEKGFDFDQPGPCRLCERDVLCGPCKICKSCNDRIDMQESLS